MFIKNKYTNVSDDTMLWRYMSFSKFQSLLESSALYFCRIDSFEDQLEATQPRGAHNFAALTENPWQVFTMQCVDKQLEIYRNMTFANCWHMNPHENPKMWKNYVILHGNEGVAIQTTFSALADSFETDRALTNLKMEYIDYGVQYMDYSYPNYPKYLSVKDFKYSYENEMRVITLERSYPEFDPDEMDMIEKIEIFTHKGELISVNTKKLIQKVYLSPNSTERFRYTVEQLLRKYDINVPVIKS